jgi:hypothetical protein
VSKAKWTVAGLVLAFSSAGYAATGELGFDSWTHTNVIPARLQHGLPGYKVTCERGTEDCLERARDVCGGEYAIGGWPEKSPRVQALVNSRIDPLNTDNPLAIYIACR